MTHLSLCSGIGGLDLAAEWAGFETVAQCEIDTYASKVLANNFPGVPNLHDIRTVTNERLAELGIQTPTVISAGFPCQPYSLAGKGLGDRDDRDLWGEVARVLGEIRPRWFVGENTPGLFARSNQRYFRRVFDDLAALGYSVGWGIWGACDVGALHRRERVFILAYSDRFGRTCVYENFKKECTKNDLSAASFAHIWSKVSTHEEVDRVFSILRDTPEPYMRVVRNDNGLSQAMDRLRCLGNAVVPQQAYPIFKAIAEFEEGKYD